MGHSERRQPLLVCKGLMYLRHMFYKEKKMESRDTDDGIQAARLPLNFAIGGPPERTVPQQETESEVSTTGGVGATVIQVLQSEARMTPEESAWMSTWRFNIITRVTRARRLLRFRFRRTTASISVGSQVNNSWGDASTPVNQSHHFYQEREEDGSPNTMEGWETILSNKDSEHSREIESLKEQYAAEKQVDEAQLKDQIARLERTIQMRDRTIENQVRKMGKKDKKYEKLKDQRDEDEILHESRLIELHEARERTRNLQARIDALRKRVLKRTRAAKAAKKLRQKLKICNQELEATKGLRQQLVSCQTTIETAKCLRGELDSWREEIQTAKTQHQDHDSMIRNAYADHVRMREHLKESAAEKEDLRARLKTANDLIIEGKAYINQREAVWKNGASELQKALALLNADDPRATYMSLLQEAADETKYFSDAALSRIQEVQDLYHLKKGFDDHMGIFFKNLTVEGFTTLQYEHNQLASNVEQLKHEKNQLANYVETLKTALLTENAAKLSLALEKEQLEDRNTRLESEKQQLENEVTAKAFAGTSQQQPSSRPSFDFAAAFSPRKHSKFFRKASDSRNEREAVVEPAEKLKHLADTATSSDLSADASSTADVVTGSSSHSSPIEDPGSVGKTTNTANIIAQSPLQKSATEMFFGQIPVDIGKDHKIVAINDEPPIAQHSGPILDAQDDTKAIIDQNANVGHGPVQSCDIPPSNVLAKPPKEKTGKTQKRKMQRKASKAKARLVAEARREAEARQKALPL